ncbi:hypothetical protein HDZ31DRAFT_66642 [Schizophyllum fasciatum]
MPPRSTRIPIYVYRDSATERLKTPSRSKTLVSEERRTRSRAQRAPPSMRIHGPIDSPRNPCGRQYKWHHLMRLPPALSSSFSHLPLVFTLIRAKSAENEPPVFRKVQVPRNYTITHIRALVMFLFDATLYDGDLFSNQHHVVEICKDADMAGNLWSAETIVKLAGAQGPYSPIRDDGPELGEGDEPEVLRTGSYRWEGEGDFLIDSVWPTTKELNPEWEQRNEHRGIIFNFNRHPHLKVHITFDASSRGCAPYPMDEPCVIERYGATTILSGNAPSSTRPSPANTDWNEPGAFKKFYMNLAKGSMALLPSARRPAIPRPVRKDMMLPAAATQMRPGVTPEGIPAHRKAISIRANDIARMARSAFLRELDELDSPVPGSSVPVIADDDDDSFYADEAEVAALLAEQGIRAPLAPDDDSDDELDAV